MKAFYSCLRKLFILSFILASANSFAQKESESPVVKEMTGRKFIQDIPRNQTPFTPQPDAPTVIINVPANYPTIQAAINAANNGDIITIDAGTYKENITLNKYLRLRGANYGINPNTGIRGPETVIQPATSDPDPLSPTAITYFYITPGGSSSVIDGIKFDGNNPTISTGFSSNGVDVDACEAIGAYDGISNTTVSNNIFENIYYSAIDFYNATNGGAATYDNLITNNKFDNINPPSYGIGVIIYNNCYTTVSYNVMTRVRVGVQTGNFSNADIGTNHSIDHNNFETYRRGIWNNLSYTNATAYDITNNELTTVTGATNNEGIEISSIQSSVGVNVSNNNITGARIGYNLWNCPTTSTVTVTGGVITNCKIGVFPNNYDGYPTGAPDPSIYAMTGITMTNCDTAIWVRDNNLNTNGATVALSINNTTNIVNGTGIGLIVEGGDASVAFSLGDPIDFNTTLSKYIRLITNGSNVPSANINAQDVKFGGTKGSNSTNAQLFAIEDKIDHKIDWNSLGFVSVKATNKYVTINSFYPPNTSAASIQNGIDISTAGDTVNIGTATFNENINLNKAVTLAGSGPASTILTPSVACSGDGINISSPNANVKDLRVTNYLYGLRTSAATISIYNVVSDLNCNSGLNTSLGTNGLNIVKCKFNDNSVAGWRAGTGDNVSNVIMDSSEAKGNTSAGNGFGISIFASPTLSNTFNNITIKNSDFSNNLKKGMYFEKLSNAIIDNVIMDNCGTDATYGFNNGIDINLKNGAYSTITIQNSSITNCGSTGTAGNVDNPAALAIKARDDAPDYNTNPATLTGFTLKNCFITGPNNGLRFGEFNKVNNSPTGNTVIENHFGGAYSNKAILNKTANPISVSCNWYGTVSATAVAALNGAGINYTPYLTDGTDNNIIPGFQIVPGSCNGPFSSIYVNDNSLSGDHYTTAVGNNSNPGTPGSPYATINYALSNSIAGDTIWVDAGTYIEDVVVNINNVSIHGSNYGISPNGGSRLAEAIIMRATSNNVSGMVVTITASNVNFNGFTVDGNNPDIGGPLDAFNGIYAVLNGLSNVNASKNIVRNTAGYGIRFQQATNFFATTVGATYSSGNTIRDNLIYDITFGGINLRNSSYAAITKNVIHDVDYGIYMRDMRITNQGSAAYKSIDSNTVQTRFAGIWFNLYHGTPYSVTNNIVNANNYAINGNTKWYGIMFSTVSGAQNFTSQPNLPLVATPEYWSLTNNTIDGSGMNPATIGHGYWLWSLDNFRDNLSVDHFTQINGGSVSNVDYGVFMNNVDNDVVNTNFLVAALGAHARINGTSISVKAAGNGIYMRDVPTWTPSNPAPLINKRDVKAEILNTTINGVSAASGIFVNGTFANANIHDNPSTITGAVIGVDVDGGTAVLYRNNITANGTGVRVKNSGNLDSATENFITSNTVEGIHIDATAGTIGVVSYNNLSGNTGFAINYLLPTPALNATCNWYGPVFVATKINGNVNYLPFLSNGTDNEGGTPGFQAVPGSCNGLPATSLYVNDNSPSGDHYTTGLGNDGNAGTSAAPFATMNHAITVAADGDTIWVDAGTYIEDVIVNKDNVSIRGSNYLINPNTGSRVAESIVMPATNNPSTGVLINLQQSNVILDGFLFNGDNPGLTGGTPVGSADVNTSEGICNGPALGPYFQIDHVNIQNNIFNNFDYQAVYLEVAFNSNHSWNYITNNKFDNMWEGIQTYALHADISFNTFTGVDRALSMHAVHAAADPGFVPQILNNTVSITWKTAYSRNIGIWVNYRDGSAPALEVKNNTINCSDASLIGKNFYGFYALTINDNRTLTFTNNTITGAGNCSRGFYMSACSSSNVRLSGGAFNNIRDYGIFMTNFDPTWLQGDSRLTVDSLPVTMSPGSTAGVWVYTDNSYANNPTNSNSTVKRVSRNDEPVTDKAVTENPNSSPSATLVSALNISHSTISGASTGIMVLGTLASANIHDNPTTITGAVIGVDVDGGSAALYRNNITANGTGLRVKNSGNLDSATENYITANTVEGINIDATAGNIGIISYNELSGNTGYAINYLKTTPSLSAMCNWYGAADGATVTSKVSGNVNFITWLTNGTDNAPGTAGFQAVPGSCNGVLTKWYVNDGFTTGDVYTTAVGNDANPGTPSAPFLTITHAMTVAATGDSIYVDVGGYPENVSVAKRLVFLGAKANVDARGRVVGSPSITVESVITPVSGPCFDLLLGSSSCVIDGFSILGNVGGTNGAIQNDAGALNSIQIRNNYLKVTSTNGQGLWFNSGITDVTIDRNELIGGTSTTQVIFMDGPDSFAGLYLTNNNVLGGGGAYGMFVNGNRNVGISVGFANRSPLIQGNLFQGFSAGINGGIRSFDSVKVIENTFNNNSVTGFQGGPRKSIFARNTFTNNGQYGMSLTGFNGNPGQYADTTRGASRTTIQNNYFSNNATASGSFGDVLLSNEAPGMQNSNLITENSFGNDTAIYNNEPDGATDTIHATCNWYGTISGFTIYSKIYKVAGGVVLYSPWLTDGTDNDLILAGFQPVPGTCNGVPDTKLFVNDNSTSGDVFTTAVGSNSNTGTASAPFLTITFAVSIANPNDTIFVDAGTYQEQVNINKSLTITGADSAGPSAAVVKAPLVMSSVTNANGSGFTSVIYAFGPTTTLNISGLGIDGDGRGGAKFSGVYYFQASGRFTNSRITKVRDATFSGVQSGNAFFANHTYDVSLNQTVTVSDNVIDDYQKTGILINELNTHGIVTNNIVTGQSVQHVNGQNGIQFGYGAYGTITGNTVTGNQYNGPSPDAASGILLAGVGVDSSNTPTGNTTTVGGAGSLANNMSADEVGLLVDGGGFGYNSNAGVTYNANNFANNYIHVSESAPNTVPSGSNVYDKRIDNTSQTNVVYGQIQRSVDDASAGNILNVSAHTFTEQVEIHKAITLAGQGIGLTTILSPNTLPLSYTTSGVNKPVVYVHDTSGVIITNLTVDGAGKGNANNRFQGIAFRNAGGTVRGCEIKDVRNTPFDGVQAGVGIYAFADNSISRNLNFVSSTVTGFQKNATVFAGADLSVRADSNTLTGAGPTSITAQNGIQISSGATGSVRYNTINNISYVPSSVVACGVLIFGPGGPDTTANNAITAVQAGIYYVDLGGVISENTISATALNTGTTTYLGIDADPGTGSRQVKIDPYDAEVTNTKSKVNISNNPSTITTSIYRNVLTSDGTNGIGIRMDVYDTETLNATATQNSVNGWDRGVQFYKDAGATLNGIVNDNDLNGNTYALYDLTGVTQNATCNWFGTSDAGAVAAKVFGAISYIPWLSTGTDNDGGAMGFQPVPGSCNGAPTKWYVNDNSLTGDVYTTAIGNDMNVGSSSAPFATINHAVSVASGGDTIFVDAGTFVEDVVVNEYNLTIRGANFGVDPNTGSRVAESIVMPATNDPSAGVLINVQKSKTKFDGFTLNGDNPGLSGGTPVGSADVNTSEGICNGPALGPYYQIDSTNIKHNIFNNFDYQAIYIDVDFNTNHSWNYITNNKFDNMWEGIQTYALHSDISRNVFTAVDRAISIHGTNVNCDPGFVPRIDSNEVSISWKNPAIPTRNTAIWVNYRRGTAPSLSVDRNTIHYPTAAPSGKKFIGFYALTITDDRVVNFSNNTIDGQGNISRGFYMSNCPSSNISLTGGTFNDIKDHGIMMVNNDPSWGAGDVRLTVSGLPITMSPGSYAGVLDSTDNSFAMNALGNDILEKRMNRNEPAAIEPEVKSDGVKTSSTAYLAALDISNSSISGSETGIKVTGTNASAYIHDNPTTISGAVIGVDINGGTAAIYRNNITANGTGVRVKNSGNLDSATENYITSNTVEGVTIEADAGSIGIISYNDLSGNTGFAIKYLKATPTLTANCNWYGVTNGVLVSGMINGNVNYIPWLTSNTDNSPGTAGFQPFPGSCNGVPETKLYVNDNSTSGDVFTTAVGSNSNPGTAALPFLTISYAVSIANPSDTILVDAGTYQEQVNSNKSLTITGADSAGSSAAIIKAPLVMSTVANANAADHTPIVYFSGASTTVNINHIGIDGDGRGGARFSGVYYFEASGSFTNSRIVKVRDATYSGVQSGEAFFANHTYDISLNQTVTVSNNVIEDYQKTGILINELNTQGIVTNNIVTGQSIQHVNGQNGIQFGFGSYGTITGNTVTGNQYNGPSPDAASGILLAGVGVNNLSIPTGNITTIGGAGILSNNLSEDEAALLVDSGGYGYNLNANVIYNANNFANNYIHVSESSPNTVPSGSNVYDKRIDNTSQTNVVYGQIQRSVDDASAGNVLNVSAHTFTEQVEIHKSVTLAGQGSGLTNIVSPNSLLLSFTTGINTNKPVIYVHDTSDVVIKNLTVDGAGKGNANYRFIGIAFRNAGGTVNGCEVKDIRETPINGNQHGVGIYSFANNGTSRSLTVTSNNIHDFQKNATVFAGADLTARIDSNTITGSGPVSFIAQNGIQLSNDAFGSVRNNIINNLSYTPGPDVSCGILLFAPSGPDTTSYNTLTATQAAIYYIDVSGVISENTISATAVNTGTTDYYGIDADPGDGPARVKSKPFEVDENTTKTKVNISNSPSSLTTSIYRNTLTSDGTNGTGIKMDVYGTETLNGTATENKVNGWDKGILFYKDAGATLNGVANDNDLSGNTFALYNLSGVAQNGTCNWFGTTYPAGVAAKVSGTVTYTPFLTNGTDNAPAISGFQPVPGSCNGPSPKLYVNDLSLTGDIYTTAVGNDANVGSPSAPFRTIAHAILFANNGDSIIVDAGSYTENDSVYKSVTIIGAGQGATIVTPLISGPTCGGGSLCPGGSNVMLIGADNVSIKKMTIDGNNPSLTSGVVVAGVDIDARNGIITNHTLGLFNNLRVDSVTVKNIYLRGIYASSGGTFTFSNDSADNIQGDPGSIAMFNFGGAGVFANNTVSNANDAISSNHSTGSVYYGNNVESSGSGIHTDNNGDGGGIADTIRNNTVSNSDLYGYGIWVFAPYKSVVVKDNTITNVDVGLANAGQGVPVTTTFTQNTVDGQNKANSAGVYQTTSLFGFGSSTVSGIYTNNFIKNNVDGFYVEYEPGNTNNINVNDNTIKGNTNGVTLAPGGTLVNDFTCNWWGSATAGDVSVAVSAPVNYIFYLTNGTDNDGFAAGFQPVPGSCNGQPLNVNYGTVDTYSYANSTDGASGAPSQPEFCWKDTTGSTNLVSNAVNKQPGIFTGDLDDGYWKILLPAGKKVRFFGTDYDTLRIGTNGIIAFKIFNPSGGNNNPPASGIPGGTVTNAFYPFWWDQNWGVINSGTTTNRLSYKVVGNQLIVTYDRAPRYAGAPGDYVSYQVCIDVSTAPASNSRLLVQFADTSNTNTGSLFASKYNASLNQTHLVGLQNSAATSSIQYRFANSTPTVITAGPLFDTLFTSLAVQFGSDNTQLNQKCQSLSLTFRLEAIQLTRKDTVTVMLRSSTLPYPVIESKKVVYDSLTGTATVPYTLAENGSSYYLFVSHRNSISTWSAAPVACISNALTYDFTTALTQAYSNNMVMVSGKASFYTGEVDSVYDGIVGLSDITKVYNDNVNFVSGSYVKTDVNYNGVVDLTDIVYVFNNNVLFVTQKNPPGAVAPFEQPLETDNGYSGDFASKDSKSNGVVSDDTKLNTKTPEENVSKEGSKNQNNSVGVDTKRTIHKKSSSNLR